MHHLLEMAHLGQHRKHRFDDHAGIPLAPLTNAEVLRMPVFLDKAFITEQQHLNSIALGDLLKVTSVVDIGIIDIPFHNQTQMIEHETQLAPDDPASDSYIFANPKSLEMSIQVYKIFNPFKPTSQVVFKVKAEQIDTPLPSLFCPSRNMGCNH